MNSTRRGGSPGGLRSGASSFPLRPQRVAAGWLLAWALALTPAEAQLVQGVPSPEIGEAHKRVLILHSLGPSFAPFDEFAAGFERELSKRSATPVEFFEASLESARFAEPTAEAPFAEYLSALFREHPLDLVVSIGGAAGRFCARHRKDLLSSTPFLTTGLERRVLGAPASPPRAAVVSVVLDLPAQIENILRVLPNTADIVIVAGTNGLGKFWIDEAEREFRPFAGRVRFTWLHDLSLEKIQERVSSLPAHTAIFYGGLSVDAAGIPHERDEALDVLRAATRAPIFGLFDTELGRGIVGGPLVPIDEASRRASEAALRILSGEAPETVVIPPVTMGAPIYDFRELARWHIPERLLPPGSTVRFRPTSAWAQYRVLILAGLAIIGFQAALIGGLLVQHSRRRAIEKEARNLTRRLITAHEDERRRLARELHDDLSQRLARLAIDAAQMEPRPGVKPEAGAARSIRDGLVRLGEDVHALSYQLHPSLIDDLGLKDALQAECERFSRTESIAAKLDSRDVPETLPPDVSLCLFRVAQEALQNVARHAHASRVNLSLQRLDGGVRLVVVDDGVGFDPSRRRSHASLGHASMRERVTLVGGKLQIESTPGRGTTISVWAPFQGGSA